MNLTIYGVPLAKQSCKFTKSGHRYTPADVVIASQNMRAQVIGQWSGALPFSAGVSMTVKFVFPYPKSTPKRDLGTEFAKITKPDIDNLLKNLLDSMQGVCFLNDGQVCEILASKKYGEQPRIEINIMEVLS